MTDRVHTEPTTLTTPEAFSRSVRDRRAYSLRSNFSTGARLRGFGI